MKKALIMSLTGIFVALFVLLTSCITSQSWVPVKGKGESVDKNFTVSDFQGIEVSGGFDVILLQGNTEGLTLTAQENLFEYITVDVEQGILKIYTKNNIMATHPMKARITFRSIENLKISGGGDVTSETTIDVPVLSMHISGGGDLKSIVNTDELKCHISGGGDAEVDGSIKNYNVDLSGGGDIHSNITSDVLSCNISGGGNLTVTNKSKASNANIDINGGGNLKIAIDVAKLNCSVSGGGDVTLTGQAEDLEISINGGGDVNAGEFITGSTIFQASGGSDIHVNATQELTGQISGGGDLYYSGSPARFSVDAKGGSEIHKQ